MTGNWPGQEDKTPSKTWCFRRVGGRLRRHENWCWLVPGNGRLSSSGGSSWSWRASRGSGEASDVAQGLPALGADSGRVRRVSGESQGGSLRGRGRGWRWGGIRRLGLELVLEGGEGFFGAGMQEAEGPDFWEAFGQDVLEKALDEAQGVQGHGFPGLFPRFVAEGDLTVLHADEPPVGQGDAVDVGRQIFQGGVAITDRLTVHDPRGGPGVRGTWANRSGAAALRASRNFARKTVRKAEPGTRNFGWAGFQLPVVGSTPPAGTR